MDNWSIRTQGEFPWTAGCLNHRLGDRLARAVDLVTWNWALYDDAPCAREHFLAEVAALPGRPIILQIQDHDVPLHACRGGRSRKATAHARSLPMIRASNSSAELSSSACRAGGAEPAEAARTAASKHRIIFGKDQLTNSQGDD